MRFLILTGLSGAGKTMAIRYLEDMGFFCVDNLPPKLILRFVELCQGSEGQIDKVAIVVDIRGRGFFDDLLDCLSEMKEAGHRYEILFLEASDDVLIKRYKESRRAHPLVREGRIISGIRKERELLGRIKEISDHIIDTSNLYPKQLKETLVELFHDQQDNEGLLISIISFGFKHGILLDADLVFDVRFLPNPFYVDELKIHTGQKPEVRDYVFKFPETREFMDKTMDMLEFLIPHYIKEGKYQLVVGIGCTGGMHRSVAIGDALYEELQEKGYRVSVEHRDISDA
ncbi:MAG: RNase adapter RapZ [Caldicoprobacterales bacterium]|nr:RNase adapter RapZ [Clostridiales bacterium]